MANPITALATIIIALIAGSAVSRVHGRVHGGTNHIGDRIFLGLLSVPFIIFFVDSIAKDLNPWAKLLTTAPVIIYVTLLLKQDWHSTSNFSKILYFSTMPLSVGFAVIYLFVRWLYKANGRWILKERWGSGLDWGQCIIMRIIKHIWAIIKLFYIHIAYFLAGLDQETFYVARANYFTDLGWFRYAIGNYKKALK